MTKDENKNDTEESLSKKPSETEKIKVNFSMIKANWPFFLSDAGPKVPPWPDDATLFMPYQYYQMILPEYANCLSVQTYLKMCKLNYQVEEKANAEFMSPTLNVPFIKVDNDIVAELEGIISFLHNRNINLADKLEPEQKTDLNAFMSLVPNILHLCELYISWVHKETYQSVTRPKYGYIYPWPLNWIQATAKRQQVIKKLDIFNWSDKSLGDVLFEFEDCCEAINYRLEGKTQFFEGHDTELDACIYGHLFAILNTALPGNHLENLVRKFPDLVVFVETMRGRFP